MSFNQFSSIPCPTYKELRLVITKPSLIEKQLLKADPKYVHVATEGPLGALAKIALNRVGIQYTSSYHTRFPEYVTKRFFIGGTATRTWQRYFHNSSIGTMVRSPILRVELARHQFNRLMPWVGGVDTRLFRPRTQRIFGRRAPVFLYVGRLAVEKNIDAFLRLSLPGLKVLVGDGPAKARLERRYPEAVFCGTKTDEDLANCYASADVFVFPSTTDTYGLTMLEAMATGIPVAAHPVAGPLDIVVHGRSGFLDWDLQKACLASLDLNRESVRSTVLDYTWENCLTGFFQNIESANTGHAAKT
jgi:glycosyltransferase involved in cell wall biosynthesis